MGRILLCVFFLYLQFAYSQGTWTQKTNFGGSARLRPVSFSIGTKGYIGTGYDANGGLGDLWEWNQTSNTWTQKASFPGTARFGAFGFAIGTKGYIGSGGSGVGQGPFTHYQDFYEWNQTTNTWSQKANFGGIAREDAVGFSIGNKGYIGTGWQINPASFTPLFKDFWQWDQATDTWTQMADFGGGLVTNAAAYATGSKGYVGTGSDYVTGGHNDFWEYDPSTNSWLQKANFPGVSRDGATAFHIGNNGYMGLGATQMTGGALSDFYKYDPTTNSWSTATSFGGGLRNNAASFSIGCYGYVTMGSLNLANTYKNDLWEFYDSTNTFCCILSATAFGATTICAGQVATLSAVGGNNYSWSNGATGAVITVTPTTTTTYTVIETSGICTDTASVSVTVLLSPTTATISGNISICLGQAATFNASGGATYLWNTGQTTSSIMTYPNMSVTYTVIVSIGMCSDTASSSVTVNPLPIPTISGSTTFCSGQSTTLTANGGSTYSWNTGATSANIIIPATSTSYIVVVTSANGCTATATSNVSVILDPIANINPNNSICLGDTATLNASGGTAYWWSTGATTNSIGVSPVATSSYSVIVGNSCNTDTANTTLTVMQNPTALFVYNADPCGAGIQFLDNSSNAISWNWNFGNGGTSAIQNPLNVYSASGFYAVTLSITDSFGCKNSTQSLVDVPAFSELYIPTAFSPNDDNNDDVYFVFGKCITQMIFKVYDRWGEKVFETTDPAIGWDGKYKGQMENTGVFMYSFDGTLTTGEKINKKGNITLMR